MSGDAAEKNYGTLSKARLRRRRSSFQVYVTFVDEFLASNGGWQIVVLGFIIALGIGCVIGVIPQVTTQRFAEDLYHYNHHNNDPPCSSFMKGQNKPEACVMGGKAAQTAASYNSMARNVISLICNSVAGSYSDVHGRRGIQLFCLFLLTLSPAALVLIQINRSINPVWYYAVDSITAMISFISIGFSMLSDVLPVRHRAASFGMYYGAFLGGLSIGPFFAVVLNHLHVGILSFVVRSAALVFAILALPETLPPEVAAANKDKVDRSEEEGDGVCTVAKMILRPIKELSILGRNKTLILVTIGTFWSKLVFSADVSLFFYYVENVLDVRDTDVACMLFVTGIVGVLVQAIFLKYFISLLGERDLLVTSFCSGTVHNLLYGIARNKAVLYIGLCLSQLTSTNGPLLSSFVSRNVDVTEQGRVQGALFALISLAEAIGPVFINYVYNNWHMFGQGTMFVVAAILYGLGTIAVSLVPPKGGVVVVVTHEEEEEDETGLSEASELTTAFVP